MSQYTDLTLKFCLQDGAPLSSAPAKQSTIDTVAFSRPVTAQNILPTQDFHVAAPQSNRTQQNVRVDPPKPRSSNKRLIAVAVFFPILVVGIVGGGLGWMYIQSNRNAAAETEKSMSVAAQETEANPPDQIKPAVPDTLKTEAAKSEPSGTVDTETIKKEVTGLVDRWKGLTEGHRASDLAGLYGEKVEYLGKPGVSPNEIRSEMQKTFEAYSDIDIDISNLSIAVDAEGTAATALFDKEWSYAASPKLTEGKAHTKMHLRKIGPDWKIVSEKNLKIYYVEN